MNSPLKVKVEVRVEPNMRYSCYYQNNRKMLLYKIVIFSVCYDMLGLNRPAIATVGILIVVLCTTFHETKFVKQQA